jgi:hypothetical protein
MLCDQGVQIVEEGLIAALDGSDPLLKLIRVRRLAVRHESRPGKNDRERRENNIFHGLSSLLMPFQNIHALKLRITRSGERCVSGDAADKDFFGMQLRVRRRTHLDR